MEPTTLASKGDLQVVIDLKLMPGFLVENESFVEDQKIVVSMLDPTTITDDGFSFAEKHDKEGNALAFLRQDQAEVYSTEVECKQCKTSLNNVCIITTDDLAPNIGMQGISESAAREPMAIMMMMPLDMRKVRGTSDFYLYCTVQGSTHDWTKYLYGKS